MKTLRDKCNLRCYLVGMDVFLALLAASQLCSMPLAPHHQRPDMVMVCDDDATDLYLAELYMRDYQCVVTACSTATEGLKRVNDDHFDYGFIDFQLDRMTALEFLKQATPKNRYIKWYVFSDEWRSLGSGSRNLSETARLGATAILKSSLRQNGIQMKNFQETIGWILRPKDI